jgi:hypothetical protein
VNRTIVIPATPSIAKLGLNCVGSIPHSDALRTKCARAALTESRSTLPNDSGEASASELNSELLSEVGSGPEIAFAGVDPRIPEKSAKPIRKITNLFAPGKGFTYLTYVRQREELGQLNPRTTQKSMVR